MKPFLNRRRFIASAALATFVGFESSKGVQAAEPSTNYVLTVGFIDTTCPPTGVYAACNALAGPKQIFNDPPSPHTVTAKANAAMRTAILARVEMLRNH